MSSRSAYALAMAVIISSIAGLRLLDPEPLVRLRLLAYDMFQRLAPRTVDPNYPVRIVDIDAASLAALGRWPWPRELLGRLVDRLGELGAVVVAFDFVFPEPEPDPVIVLRQSMKDDPAASALLDKLPAHTSGDARFAEAIRRGNVVLGAIGQAGTGPVPPAPTAFALLGSDPGRHVPAFGSATLNTAAVNEAALGVGSLNWLPESDQIVRKVPLVVRFGGELYPSLVADTVRLAQGASTIVVRSATASAEGGFGVESGITSVRIGDARIPTDATGQAWLAFSFHDPMRFVSAKRVLDGTIAGDDIAGRIVLVGTSAPGLFDLRATPLDAVAAGVEVHAQAIEQILQGRFLFRPDYATGLEIVLTVLGSVVLASLIYLVGAFAGAGLGALAVATVLGTSAVGYFDQGLLIDPTFPILGLTAVYIFGSGFLYLRTERERDRVREAFGHYLAPSLVERLAREPERLQLGGETRQLTVLFSDVRGFTSIAETYRDNPADLIALMNRLLTPLTDAITASGGTIDKYMGDAIMAFWNAPLDDPEHSRHACEVSLEMIARLEALNAERALESLREGREPAAALHLGIGIATGNAIVGNMGSRMRFDYSALGDAVNLASRIEGLTAVYHVSNLVSDLACRDGAGALEVLEVDVVRVKGRKRPDRIWTILGRSEAEARAGCFREQYAAALAAYRRREWEAARSLFERAGEAGAEIGLKGLAEMFASRCAALAARPPHADWDGVWDCEKG
jgi:adenylate cyclase